MCNYFPVLKNFKFSFNILPIYNLSRSTSSYFFINRVLCTLKFQDLTINRLASRKIKTTVLMPAKSCWNSSTLSTTTFSTFAAYSNLLYQYSSKLRSFGKRTDCLTTSNSEGSCNKKAIISSMQSTMFL